MYILQSQSNLFLPFAYYVAKRLPERQCDNLII